MVALPLDEIAVICRRHAVTRLELFGSVAHGDPARANDIDPLVSFRPDRAIGWGIVALHDDLQQLLGAPVDLVPRDAIEASPNRLRRESILADPVTLYADSAQGT